MSDPTPTDPAPPTPPRQGPGVLRSAVPPAVSLTLHSAVLLTIVALGARDRREYLADDANLSDVTARADDPAARRAVALDPPAPQVTPQPEPDGGADPGTPEPDPDVPVAHAEPDPEPAPVDLTGLSTTLATVETGSVFTGAGAPATASRLFAAAPGAARPAPAASFAGLRSQAASRIVYAVDASGAVVSSFTFLQEKLVQSIDRLGPAQRFNVVFFHDIVGRDDPPFEALSGDTLTPAIPGNQAAAAAWIDSIIPSGRSDPLDGLRPALAMKPDVIFLLSTSIPRTNAEWGSGRDAILAELDRLNPIDPRTGKRPVVIKTIQFLREDPSGLMRDIAMIHGDGEGSYRMLTVNELRDEPDDLPEIAVDPSDPSGELMLAAAAARLGTAERDGSVLAALYAVPLPDQRSAAENAAREALDLLSNFPADGSGDLRAAMLRARAAIILAMLTPDERTRTALARTALANAQNQQLPDPRAETARRITRLLALSLLGEDGPAARDARELADEIARTDPQPADLAEPVLAWARVARDDVSRSEAMDALASVARSRALASDPLWAHTLAAARARLALSATPPSARAFDELLALLDRDDLIPDDAARRSMVYATISAAAEPFELDWSRFPPEAAFAHALDVGRTAPGRARAVRLLTQIADRPAEPALQAQALWEAAVLRRLDNTREAQRDASRLLARLAREHPGSPHAADALAASINEARASDGELPESFELDLVKRAIASFPDRPEIDIWRIDYAKRVSGMDRLDALEPVAPGTRQATLAAELYFPASRTLRQGASPTQRLALLDRAVSFARRHNRAEWAPLAADLADEAAESDPATSARLAQTLLQSPGALKLVPGGADRLALVHARAKRAMGDDAGAFEIVRTLATRLEAAGERSRDFWHAWTIMLEILAQRPDDASHAGARAHLARLRLLDPALGGPPFASRLTRVAESLDSPP